MSLSPLPLGYCTNVHPGRSVAEVERGLDEFTVAVCQNIGRPMAAGLWLANSVVGELLNEPDRLTRFADGLQSRGLSCHTLNAFPFGDFHSPRVKEQVYLPDWSQPDRLDYTTHCAHVLAALLPEHVDGSLSSVPLGFKQFDHPEDFVDRCIDRLIELARRLARLRDETGRVIRLALEPEPLCVIETAREVIEFFDRLRQRAADAKALELVEQFSGVCYDVCHQAVEFEDIGDSIALLARAGVRINKLHITCAIQLDRPFEDADARAALARYVEPRYLHQTFARSTEGAISHVVDLTESLAREPPPPFDAAEQWRVHFHVPVDAEQLGPLGTTRGELKQALTCVAGRLDYAPHLEVETYTWEVLPDGGTSHLVDGLTREMLTTQELLRELT